jgi:HEAT repeat protein
VRLAVNDPDADIRVLVCRIWGKRGDAEAAKLLAGMLTSDTDKDVRKAAARELGHTHDPAATAALGGALDDPDPAMQHVAMVSLKETTGQDFGQDADRWRQFVKNGSVDPSSSPSFAQRLLHWF